MTGITENTLPFPIISYCFTFCRWINNKQRNLKYCKHHADTIRKLKMINTRKYKKTKKILKILPSMLRLARESIS